MLTFFPFILAAIGLVCGSFAGAQVWRLRARQLVEDKAAGEDYDKKEYKQLVELTKHRGRNDRSRCLNCHHILHWYDLFPLVSWLSTRGRCRYCNHSIGWFEPLMELGVSLYFVLSFLLWPSLLSEPFEIARFALWLVAGVQLAILFGYDAKWFLLPDRVVFPLIAVAAIYALLGLTHAPNIPEAIFSLLGSIGILSGIYLSLWLLSKGRWIGFGDVKLGVALGLLLGRWELAFLALFLANLIGCLIVIPGLISKRFSRTTRVPFGPMLIAGFFITALWGDTIIGWYLSTSLMLML